MMQSHVRDRYKDMMMLGLCSDHLYTVLVHALLYMPLLLSTLLTLPYFVAI